MEIHCVAAIFMITRQTSLSATNIAQYAKITIVYCAHKCSRNTGKSTQKLRNKFYISQSAFIAEDLSPYPSIHQSSHHASQIETIFQYGRVHTHTHTIFAFETELMTAIRMGLFGWKADFVAKCDCPHRRVFLLL